MKGDVSPPVARDAFETYVDESISDDWPFCCGRSFLYPEQR